jgi:peptidoglycan/xylan/chitin deacetylase (PgdA/CDA1 family)
MKARWLMAVVMAAAVAAVMGVSKAGASGPISNDCSAGTVEFTFDDGPDVNTPQVIQTLQSLNLTATFFVNGDNVVQHPDVVLAEYQGGFGVQNHTWDHASFTGASTGTQPLTDQQVTDELRQTDQAIVAAGVPAPTLYRPPYGDVNSYYDLLARNLGYRIVMSWGTPTANIVDSRDWTGISPAQIVQNVTQGYTVNGLFYPGIKADSIVSMHDGEYGTTQNTIAALPGIVDYMNSQHLCSTSTIRPDATGGVVPVPAPPEPTSGNLVTNPSLEQLRTQGNTTEPVCFQQAGASTGSNNARWSLTSDARTGNVAERVDVTSSNGGDRKLVLTQRQSEQSCLASVTPGRTYSMWVGYKGSWAYQGTATKVSIVTYYRNGSGQWLYWQASPLYPPTSAYNLAYFTTAPLPAGATAVSFGLAIQGVGMLITDDYAMVQN